MLLVQLTMRTAEVKSSCMHFKIVFSPEVSFSFKFAFILLLHPCLDKVIHYYVIS